MPAKNGKLLLRERKYVHVVANYGTTRALDTLCIEPSLFIAFIATYNTLLWIPVFKTAVSEIRVRHPLNCRIVLSEISENN